MGDDHKIYVSLENMVNGVANRHHFSKEQKEKMYREWANLAENGTVKFDEKGDIVGFAPDAAIEKVEIKIMIGNEGEVEIV